MRKFGTMLVAVALAVAVPLGNGHGDDFPLEYAVLKLSGCTATAIGPRIAMTASHCVPRLQSKIPVRFHDGSTTEGRVIWDSYYLREQRHGLDVAFLVLDKTTPYFIEVKPFSERCPKKSPCLGWTTGFSGGIYYWDEDVKIVGPYFVEGFEWVYIYRGDLMPGASGSVIFVNRQIVGLLTNGTMSLSPPFVLGATALRLSEALQNLVDRGEMRWCKETEKTPKRTITREEVCPR